LGLNDYVTSFSSLIELLLRRTLERPGILMNSFITQSRKVY